MAQASSEPHKVKVLANLNLQHNTKIQVTGLSPGIFNKGVWETSEIEIGRTFPLLCSCTAFLQRAYHPSSNMTMEPVTQPAKAATFVLHDVPEAKELEPQEYTARLGTWTKRNQVIETPNFIAITSRGVVPHMTPDVLTQHTQFQGVHMAIEDCRFE
jgi:hypothetical protein